MEGGRVDKQEGGYRSGEEAKENQHKTKEDIEKGQAGQNSEAGRGYTEVVRTEKTQAGLGGDRKIVQEECGVKNGV